MFISSRVPRLFRQKTIVITVSALSFRPARRFTSHQQDLLNIMAVRNGVRKDSSFYQFAAFRHESFQTPRIGHFDTEKETITPLSYRSGTPLQSLYEVIELGGHEIVASGEPIARSECKLLAPISGRDILAVGKNYAASRGPSCNQRTPANTY